MSENGLPPQIHSLSCLSKNASCVTVSETPLAGQITNRVHDTHAVGKRVVEVGIVDQA